MNDADASGSSIRPSNGRGKVVVGFLLYNVAFVLLLDSRMFWFSVGLLIFGALTLIAGHIENYVAIKAFRTRSRSGGTSQPSLTAALVLAASLILPGLAWSKPALNPTEQIQEIDKLLRGFHKAKKGERLTAAEEKENLQIKHRVLKDDFDMNELCRLALADHWQGVASAKRTEFVEVFTRLLLNNAILHSEKHTGQEKISYLSEEPIKKFPGRVLVKTRLEVQEESVDFDVNYAMVLDAKKNRWRIYDLILDNESLLQNYEDQFEIIITKHNFDYLLQRMKKKLQEKQARIDQSEKISKNAAEPSNKPEPIADTP